MSIEAFIWKYRDGEPVGFEYDVVRDVFSTKATSWDGEHGCLNVWFENPVDSVDIYLGKDAPNTNHVEGITIARPLAHPDYLARVFQVMQLGDVMHFYSDETTPVFLRDANPGQYPADLLVELGTPRFIDEPSGLLHKY
ncbi:MAG: hypothetical protein ACK6DB_16570 [Planctomycetota bacterium]